VRIIILKFVYYTYDVTDDLEEVSLCANMVCVNWVMMLIDCISKE
jgi:hypothetical protein